MAGKIGPMVRIKANQPHALAQTSANILPRARVDWRHHGAPGANNQVPQVFAPRASRSSAHGRLLGDLGAVVRAPGLGSPVFRAIASGKSKPMLRCLSS